MRIGLRVYTIVRTGHDIGKNIGSNSLLLEPKPSILGGRPLFFPLLAPAQGLQKTAPIEGLCFKFYTLSTRCV